MLGEFSGLFFLYLLVIVSVLVTFLRIFDNVTKLGRAKKERRGWGHRY